MLECIVMGLAFFLVPVIIVIGLLNVYGPRD